MPTISTPPPESEAVANVNDAEDNQEDKPYEYKTVDVVVTGFGPFRQIKINPSYQISQALPTTLSLEQEGGETEIKIHRHPDPIHVAWENVYQTVPRLYNTYAQSKKQNSGGNEQAVPFFIHIGAGLYGEYDVESRAHRDGYSKEDEDGKQPPVQSTMEFLKFKKEKRGFPEVDDDKELHTGIDVSGVVEDVKGDMPDMEMPIKKSEDAGHFLCDFIFYASLHEAKKRFGEKGLERVLFVHVPPDGEQDEGVEVLSSIIRSVVRRSLA